jgi:hypothetical protein
MNENNGDILPEKAASSPGVFVWQFVASTLQDTFFNSTGWGKGQLFVNGYNLGRYWATAGPQVTIIIKSNIFFLDDFICAQTNYTTK